MSFQKIKQNALKKLEKAVQEKEVDKPALKILKIINEKPGFFTTSSCYGRIMLINFAGKKGKSRFISKWHRTVSLKEVEKALEKARGEQVWFRAEPFILHVSCKDLLAAGKILDIKNKLGIKRGGLFHIGKKRTQIELEGTQRMEALVKIKNKTLVDNFHLKKLVEIANQRFKENEKDWNLMEKEFEKINAR